MDRRLRPGVILLVFLAGCGQMAAPPSDGTVAETDVPKSQDPAALPGGETAVPVAPPSDATVAETNVLKAEDPVVLPGEEAAPSAPLPDQPDPEPAMPPVTRFELRPLDGSAAEQLPPMIDEAPGPLAVPLPQPDMDRGSSPPDRSPRPEVVDKGFSRIRVFYGTDRRRMGDTANEFYGHQRGLEDGNSPLELGYCDVSIPYKHTPGEIERPSVWRFEFREVPSRHVVLLDVQPLEPTRWQREFQQTLDESPDRAAMVFVHGFNVDFASAARRTAQMKYDLGFRGAAVLYSWPAPGNYVECEGNAVWTLPHLMEFLTEYVHKSGAERIHLIAHSMGTRVLATALKELATSPAAANVRYNQIVLAAPDIDADVFKRQIAPRIVDAAERISIYSSSKDLALAASKKVHRYKRLGEGGANLTTFPEWRQIEVLDASNVDESLLGHSYYGNSPTILRDVRGVLDGIAAATRGLRAQADYYLFHSRRTQLSERLR